MPTLISLGNMIPALLERMLTAEKVFGLELFRKDWKVDDVNDLCVEVFCICSGVSELQLFAMRFCCQILEKRSERWSHCGGVEEDREGVGVVVMFERDAVAQYVFVSSAEMPQRKDVAVPH